VVKSISDKIQDRGL